MSKTVKVLIALALALVLATPAMAAMKLNGYYRLQFVSDNIGNAGAKDARTASQIDQRLRLKLTNTLNDYVSFVYYAEVDTPWGQAGSTPSADNVTVTSTSTTNAVDALGNPATVTTTSTATSSKGENGGKLGADGVNVETKNVYLVVKVPNTALSVKAGVQGFGTKNYTIFGDDFAALRLDYKLSDMASLVALYGKFDEGASKTSWDDTDVYVLLGKFKLSDSADVNVGLAYGDYNTDTAGNDGDDVYVLFADGDFNLGMAKLEAQAAYSFGTTDSGTASEGDISGYMASAKATVNAGGADLGLRLTYYSADDTPTDNDTDSFAGNIDTGAYEFPNENLHIFMYDKYYNNTNGGGLLFTSNGPAYGGYGLFGVNATANVKLGGGYDLKAGAGYFMALEKNGKQDTDLGFEVAADFGRKLAEKVDVRLIGAYAVLGDFYNDATANNNDPDDVYLTKAVINVSF